MAGALPTHFGISLNSPISCRSQSDTPTYQVLQLPACVNRTLRQAVEGTQTRRVSKHVTTYSWPLHRSVFHRSHDLIYSARLPPTQAQMVQFKAKREVSIPCREGVFPAVEYLKELERVVKVTFPDSARITYVGDSVWRTRLKPITFFTVSATPVCDIKLYYKDNALRIESDRLLLDFSGVPSELQKLNVQFRLQGQMQTSTRKGSQPTAGRQVEFCGGVSLSLRVDLPLPFSLFPEVAVTTVGDGLLDSILGAMESALVRGVIADYHSWCWTKQSMESNRGPQALRMVVMEKEL